MKEVTYEEWFELLQKVEDAHSMATGCLVIILVIVFAMLLIFICGLVDYINKK